MISPESVRLPPFRDGEYDGPFVPERNRILYEMLNLESNSEEEIRGVVSVYLAMTRFVDDSIGRIIDKLESLRIRDNTIIVFTADHGDFAGEHNMMSKGGVFYDCLVRVPLIVSWPGGGVPTNVVDDSLVNTIDVLPTLLQLSRVADFTQPPPVGPSDDLAPAGPRILMDTHSDLITSENLRRFQGAPLPTVTNAAPRSAAFSEYGAGGPSFTTEMLRRLPQQRGILAVLGSLWARESEGRRRMVRTKRWKYVTDPTTSLGQAAPESGTRNEDELYDLEADPWELRNVAHERSSAPIISEMRQLLVAWLADTEDAEPVPIPRVIGRGPKPEFDTTH